MHRDKWADGSMVNAPHATKHSCNLLLPVTISARSVTYQAISSGVVTTVQDEVRGRGCHHHSTMN
jgi:hypothetical protein